MAQDDNKSTSPTQASQATGNKSQVVSQSSITHPIEKPPPVPVSATPSPPPPPTTTTTTIVSKGGNSISTNPSANVLVTHQQDANKKANGVNHHVHIHHVGGGHGALKHTQQSYTPLNHADSNGMNQAAGKTVCTSVVTLVSPPPPTTATNGTTTCSSSSSSSSSSTSSGGGSDKSVPANRSYHGSHQSEITLTPSDGISTPEKFR